MPPLLFLSLSLLLRLFLWSPGSNFVASIHSLVYSFSASMFSNHWPLSPPSGPCWLTFLSCHLNPCWLCCAVFRCVLLFVFFLLCLFCGFMLACSPSACSFSCKKSMLQVFLSSLDRCCIPISLPRTHIQNIQFIIRLSSFLWSVPLLLLPFVPCFFPCALAHAV